MLKKNAFAMLVGVLILSGFSNPAFSSPIQYPAMTDEPMSFKLVTLSDANIRDLGPWSEITQGGNRSLILANGQIFGRGQKAGVEATSDTFSNFLSSHYISPGTMLMMASGGGNLYDSFLVGQQIRQAGLRTSVIPDAICASACNFMFMGGTVRTIPATSAFVVHRFAPFVSKQVDERQAGEEAQMESGNISTYLKEMGIDSDFLVLMSKIENQRPQAVSTDLLKQLQVLNSGTVTKWIEGSLKGVFYVEAVTTKADNNGTSDRLGLLCDAGKLYLRALYSPHAGDYVRPSGVASVDPDPYGMLKDSPSMKRVHDDLDQYPLWDATTPSLLDMTYGVTVESFPIATIDIRKSDTILMESTDHQFAIAMVRLTQDLFDLLMKSNEVGFGFLISGHNQAAAAAMLSTQPHANDFSRASVSFHTKLATEGKDKLQSFVSGCGGIKN